MEGVARAASSHDVLLMGCTRDRAHRTTHGASGLWGSVGEAWSGPSLLVRRQEARGNRWWNQLWDLAFIRLPTLSVGERAEVYAQMRPKSQDRLAKMSPARRTRFLGRMSKIMAKGLCNSIRHGLPYDLELKLKKVTLKTPCKELAPLIKIGLAPPKR